MVFHNAFIRSPLDGWSIAFSSGHFYINAEDDKLLNPNTTILFSLDTEIFSYHGVSWVELARSFLLFSYCLILLKLRHRLY